MMNWKWDLAFLVCFAYVVGRFVPWMYGEMTDYRFFVGVALAAVNFPVIARILKD